RRNAPRETLRRRAADRLLLERLELGVVDHALLLEIGETGELVGGAAAAATTGGLAHRGVEPALLCLRGFLRLLRPLVAARDEVHEDAEIGEDDHEDHPQRLRPAGEVVAAEQVDEDGDEDPDPDEEQEEPEHRQEHLSRAEVVADDHYRPLLVVGAVCLAVSRVASPHAVLVPSRRSRNVGGVVEVAWCHTWDRSNCSSSAFRGTSSPERSHLQSRSSSKTARSQSST